MLRPAFATALTMLLSACGSGSPSAREVDAAVANAAATAEEARNKAPPNPSPPAVPATAIPAAFQARWGLTPADCTSGSGDAKGLLTISGDTLQFYESRARLARLIGSWPEKLEGEFAFTGEGQSWTKTMTLALTGSSNTLVRTDEGMDFRYQRCDTALRAAGG